MSRSPITCHVLDASVGKPAQGVKVQLEALSVSDLSQGQQSLEKLASGSTNADGRCSDLLDPQTKLSPGIYKMTFHSGEYFKAGGVETFYPLVETHRNITTYRF